LDVSVNNNSVDNLFYWFFRNENTNAPFLVWLNGGPGASSMFGLFLENGPLRINRIGKGLDDLELVAADKAWTDDYHVIFIDQPVNTGFSFGNLSLTSMDDGSNEFLKFLQQFYKLYPDLK
jgi:carboxypeptidase C (cathepsin A)